MLLKNIRRSLISLLLTSALLLTCGCQSNENDPQISDSNTSAPRTDKDDTITTIPDKDEITTTVTESETDAAPAETTEKVLEPIPEEWIPIENYEYTFDNFDALMSIDNSQGDIKDIIRSLTYKSIMLHYTHLGSTYEFDYDSPMAYTYGEGISIDPIASTLLPEKEVTIYPVTSAFFPDVKSFYELINDIYGDAENDYIYVPSDNSIYLKWNSETTMLFFVEIDGKMYVNPNCCIKRGGGPEPFTETSYIEIVDDTTDRYSIRWHYPDVEKLNEPDKYVGYHYYKKHYEVIYSGGEWHLDDRIHY